MITSGGYELTAPAGLLPASGPLGADDVQDALDQLAAAVPTYTVETQSNVVIAASPSWTVIKTFTIAVGKTRHLRAQIDIAGGNSTTPTSATINLLATARRTGAGTTSVGSGIPQVDASGISPTVSWVVSGNDAALRLRASGGPTVNLTLRYAWTEKTSP